MKNKLPKGYEVKETLTPEEKEHVDNALPDGKCGDLERMLFHLKLEVQQEYACRLIAKHFSEVDKKSVEEWIDGFKHDMHPDREITVWLRIAATYIKSGRVMKLSIGKKKSLYRFLVLFSMTGDKKDAIKKSGINSKLGNMAGDFYLSLPSWNDEVKDELFTL